MMLENLTLKNVKNTEWFEQFNEYQQLEILDGLEQGVDVTL